MAERIKKQSAVESRNATKAARTFQEHVALCLENPHSRGSEEVKVATRSRKSKGSKKKGSRKAAKRKTTARRKPARKTTTRRKPKPAARKRPVARKKARRKTRANPIPAATPRTATLSAATLTKLLENAKKPRSRRRPARRKLEQNPRPKRRTARRPRRANANPTSAKPVIHVINANPWAGHPRLHAKAAKKGWARRKRGKGKRKTTARRGSCKPRCTVKQAAKVLGRRGGLHDNPMLGLSLPETSSVRLSNPLEQNPFTTQGMMSFVLGAAVAGGSFWVADLLDKGIATRKPKGGKFPYYGAEAAAAQSARPDAWRLAAQIAAAAASLAAAWGLRKHSNLATVALGAGAVGFLGNTFKLLGNWYIGPMIFKVKPEDANKPSIGNRFFAVEQDHVQKDIVKLFSEENWKTSKALLNAQTPGADGKPMITSVANQPFAGMVLALGGASDSGKARTNGDAAGAVGSGHPRVFLSTGRLGNCPSCGGHDGCYSDCNTLCPNCEDYCPSTECEYEVQRGDDLAALAAAGGVSIETVNAMNGGTPDQYWIAGRIVKLPYGVCQVIHRMPEQPLLPEQPMEPVVSENPPSTSVPGVGPFEMEAPPTAPPPYVPPVVAGPQPVLAGSPTPIINVFDLAGAGLDESEENEEA